MISTRRLLRMSGDELMFRARQAGRTAAQRVAVGVRPPRWRREEVFEILADGILDDTYSAGDDEPSWQAVHAELCRRIAQRTSRFVLDPACERAIRDRVNRRWPNAASDAVTRANNVLAGRYDLLGYRQLAWISSDGAVDWHLDPVAQRTAPRRFWANVPYLDPATGDHKVIWELNRHQHWLQLGRALWLTGDLRYRRCMIQQLESWLTANPPLIGINWASMLEIAMRAISWMWGLHFLLPHERAADAGRDADPWLADMLVALNRQLTHVEQNLSVYFSPNTHLTGEALGLYVVGVALPELAGSPRWTDTGRRVLIEEIGRQIHPDGGHVERSTHYQRYTLDFYLMALLTARRDSDPEAVAIFTDAVRRLAEYSRTMADDEGQLPLIGDDDGGMLWPITGRRCPDVRDSLCVAAVLLDRPDLAPWGLQEEAVWIGGTRICDPEPSAAETAPQSLSTPRSRVLEDTGFVVFRDAAGRHATFDVAERHYSSGGHEHASALSITLGLGGQPLLIDPGTSTYTMNARLRDLLRSTASHNTLTIDDRPQAFPRGPFNWHTRATARLSGSRFNERFGWAEALHDGYRPIHHRRTIVKTDHGDWLIADEILGSGRVMARAHWHFDPRWTVTPQTPGCVLAAQGDGTGAWLLHEGDDILVAHGDDPSGLGWYAPAYGMLAPAWTVRATRQGDAPYALVSCIGARAEVSNTPPALERVEPSLDSEGIALGARVLDADGSSVFLVRPGYQHVTNRVGCSILDYQTDARILHYRQAHGRVQTIDFVDASHVLALRPDWLTVTAVDLVSDLHISLAADGIDIWSSKPPPQICLQGGVVGGITRIRMNGRAMEVRARSHTEGLVIYGSDWALVDPHPPSDAVAGVTASFASTS